LTGKKIIGGIVLCAVFLSLVAAALLSGVRKSADESAGAGIKDSVGIIDINGVIMGGRSAAGIFGGSTVGSETVMSQLRLVTRKTGIKAVVLRINSPGGSAAAAQEIAEEIQRLKKTGVKVVVSMGDTAASGAYWIAAVSDKIVANPGTMTGSIGVIIKTQNYSMLYDKLGIDTNTFKSGDYKDMGMTDRPVTEEEKKIFQSMVDDTYQQFIETVAGGRQIEPEDVIRLNGRVLTGRQALEAGLVDILGNYYDAVGLAGEISGLGSSPKTVNLTPKGQWWSFLTGTENTAVFKSFLSSVGNSSSYQGVLLLCPLFEK